MTIAQIKSEMINYRDFYGCDIPDTDKIAQAKTKRELKEILWEHEQEMEDRLNDAKSHLEKFKKKLGLHLIY